MSLSAVNRRFVLFGGELQNDNDDTTKTAEQKHVTILVFYEPIQS